MTWRPDFMLARAHLAGSFPTVLCLGRRGVSSPAATRLHAASLAGAMWRERLPEDPRVSCYARRRLRGHPTPPIQFRNCAFSRPCSGRSRFFTGTPSGARRASARMGEFARHSRSGRGYSVSGKEGEGVLVGSVSRSKRLAIRAIGALAPLGASEARSV